MSRVTATAPTRIDLAGGTLDLYPLSAFLGSAVTVNVAIDIACRVEITARDDGKVALRSEDAAAALDFDSLEALERHEGGSALDLLVEAIRFFRPATGLEVTTRNLAPRGSGLGASSALLVALLGALEAFEGRPGAGAERLCTLAAAIEAKHLQVPTGQQDYYSALLGGPLSIEWTLGGARPALLEPPAGFVEWFESAALLFFTGEPHFSGAPNWAILKRYVDGDEGTRASLCEIDRLARRMREAVAAGDREGVAATLAAEWEARKRLAAGVTTPALERIIAAARGAGASAAKACGAGGGGSIVIVAPPERAAAVAAAAEGAGARRLPFRVARAGLRIAT